VPRSGAEARRRLQQAALELYGERGFDRTTTAEIAEHASLTDALAEALRHRGVPGGTAGLAAQTRWATFHHAAQAWIDDPAPSLDVHLSQAFDDLRALSSPGAER
jgi:hypothetical protein